MAIYYSSLWQGAFSVNGRKRKLWRTCRHIPWVPEVIIYKVVGEQEILAHLLGGKKTRLWHPGYGTASVREIIRYLREKKCHVLNT